MLVCKGVLECGLLIPLWPWLRLCAKSDCKVLQGRSQMLVDLQRLLSALNFNIAYAGAVMLSRARMHLQAGQDAEGHH